MTTEEFQSDVMPVKNKLYRFALRLLGDSEEAQDVVQEIFLRLWSKRENLSEYRSIEAFAMTMTRNLCFDKLKSPSSKKEIFDESIGMTDNRTPYTETELSDTMKMVRLAMNELPEQQRMVIHLRDVEGCDFDEIAEVTGMSMNNVRVNLSRARKKIRDTLIKIHNYEFSKN
ncbi:MAG: sigma-70 family RNA polymerase sigma factor [Cyclobacteriaceae bacterium]|nr:sigma-70 family RNA polymerase sigma factor [Cyclobacteriaceae bacterium]